MLNFMRRFCRVQDGAVTVDWVVLTAAIVGLSVAVIATVGQGATDKSTGLGAALSSRAIATY